MNAVEQLLEEHGPQSIRQLKLSGLPKKTIKYHIYTSKRIGDASPVMYGSCKSKINVYTLIPPEKENYIKRKRVVKRKQIVKEPVVQETTLL